MDEGKENGRNKVAKSCKRLFGEVGAKKGPKTVVALIGKHAPEINRALKQGGSDVQITTYFVSRKGRDAATLHGHVVAIGRFADGKDVSALKGNWDRKFFLSGGKEIQGIRMYGLKPLENALERQITPEMVVGPNEALAIICSELRSIVQKGGVAFPYSLSSAHTPTPLVF